VVGDTTYPGVDPRIEQQYQEMIDAILGKLK